MGPEDTSASARLVGVGDARRPEVLRHAHRLAVVTVVWNVAEGVVALGAAWLAGSRALTGFGLDSAIESGSATVLLWRLAAERRHPEQVERVDRAATRVIGASFVVLAAFVLYQAIGALILRQEPHESPVGIAVTAASLMVMPVLARRKRRVAVLLGSPAAQADSAQSRACAYLSAVVLGGLALNAALGWWWADPVAALGVAALVLHQGHQALSSEHVDDCC